MVGGGARASECATFVAQGGFSITLFPEGQRVPMFRLQPPQFRKIVFCAKHVSKEGGVHTAQNALLSAFFLSRCSGSIPAS